MHQGRLKSLVHLSGVGGAKDQLEMQAQQKIPVANWFLLVMAMMMMLLKDHLTKPETVTTAF